MRNRITFFSSRLTNAFGGWWFIAFFISTVVVVSSHLLLWHCGCSDVQRPEKTGMENTCSVCLSSLDIWFHLNGVQMVDHFQSLRCLPSFFSWSLTLVFSFFSPRLLFSQIVPISDGKNSFLLLSEWEMSRAACLDLLSAVVIDRDAVVLIHKKFGQNKQIDPWIFLLATEQAGHTAELQQHLTVTIPLMPPSVAARSQQKPSARCWHKQKA